MHSSCYQEFITLLQARPGPSKGNTGTAGALDISKALIRPAGQTPRYPICFLTNGGGVTEEQKADELSSWLGVHVKDSQARNLPKLCSNGTSHTWQGVAVPWADYR